MFLKASSIAFFEEIPKLALPPVISRLPPTLMVSPPAGFLSPPQPLSIAAKATLATITENTLVTFFIAFSPSDEKLQNIFNLARLKHAGLKNI